jgi:hypothetical protein
LIWLAPRRRHELRRRLSPQTFESGRSQKPSPGPAAARRLETGRSFDGSNLTPLRTQTYTRFFCPCARTLPVAAHALF